jgi:ATP-dependent DNA helicase RecG
LEDVERRFTARNTEHEVLSGLFRIPIPEIAPEAFREAFNNAVLHRDYTINNAVYVQWHPDRLLITNPGGFPRGITLENLLVHEPTPRNRVLADVFRRLGLVERTGRGIDKIFFNQLRYGRPIPDYTHSDASSVRVSLSSDRSGIEFARFVFEQGGLGRRLDLDELLILDHLRRERRTNSSRSAQVTQKSPVAARQILERFVEWGIAEARGERQGRIYLLGSVVYRALGERAEYVRTSGFDRIQHEAMILQFIDAFGSVRRADVIELCAMAPKESSKLLNDMTRRGVLHRNGERRGTFYTRA